MAKKVIKQEDLIEKGIFEEPIKQSEDLLAIIKSLKEEFKGLAKVSLSNLKNTNAESAEGAKELAKETQKANVIVKESNKLAKEEEELTARITSLKSKERQEQNKLNKELEEEAKADLKKRIAKEQLANTTRKLNAEVKRTVEVQKAEKGSINALRAETRLLIQERNKLDTTSRSGRKELIELNKKIDENTEKIKANASNYEKQKLNIGNYAGQFNNLSGRVSQLGQSLGIAGGQSAIFGQALGLITGNPIQLAISTFNLFKSAVTGLGSDGVTALTKFQRASKLMGAALKSAILPLTIIIASATAFFSAFDKGQDTIEDFGAVAQATFGVIVKRLGNLFLAFGNFGELLTNQFQKYIQIFKRFNLELLDALPGVDNTKQIKELDKSIQELDRNDLGNLLEVFDGMGAEIATVSANAVVLRERLRQVEKNGFRLKILLAEISKLEGVFSIRVGDETLNTEEQEKAAARLTDIREKSLALRKAQAKEEFEANLANIANERGVNIQRLREAVNSQKGFETIGNKQLEQLADLREAVLQIEAEIETSREEINSKERATTQKNAITRIALLRDFIGVEQSLLSKRVKDTGDNFEKTLDIYEEFGNNAEETFNRQIEVLQKFAKNGIDEQRLLTIESATELEEAIKDTGISNKLTKILGDVIAERKKQLDSISIANDEFIAKENKRLDDLSLKRKGLDGALTDEELKNSGLILKADQSGIEKANKARQDKLDADKKAQEEERQAIQETSELVINEINRRADAQIEANQKQIDSRKETIERQQDLAERGLDNTLEFEQKKLAEAELKQKELEEAKVRREKVIAYYKILQSSVLDGDSTTAPFRALATITASEAIAATLGGLFADGGYTGDGNGKKDSTGFKRAGIVHEGEYVIPKKILDTPMGAEIAETAERMRVGASPRYSLPVVATQNLTMQNELIKIREAISKQKQVDVSWDSFDNRIEKIKVEAYTRTIKHVKKRTRI